MQCSRANVFFALQIYLVDASKNASVGITGKAILALYFTICSLSRFLTFASLYQDYIFINEFFPDSASKRIAILFSSTILPFCLHFVGSGFLQKWIFGDWLRIDIQQRLLYALWSFICPPLFLDWELIHRSSGYTMPIRKCFRRSVVFFACHNILIFVETMLYSIPIFVFKNDIDSNPTKWSGYYVWIVGVQIKLLIANVIVIPPILGGLAYFYFVVKGHPWARILKRELTQGNEDIKPRERNLHREITRATSEKFNSRGAKCNNLTRSKSGKS